MRLSAWLCAWLCLGVNVRVTAELAVQFDIIHSRSYAHSQRTASSTPIVDNKGRAVTTKSLLTGCEQLSRVEAKYRIEQCLWRLVETHCPNMLLEVRRQQEAFDRLTPPAVAAIAAAVSGNNLNSNRNNSDDRRGSDVLKVSSSDYTYPHNLRVLGIKRSSYPDGTIDTVYMAFDVVSVRNKPLFGNWWTLRVSNDAFNHLQHRMIKETAGMGLELHVTNSQSKLIEYVGRVVDHWNGNYSVYFQLPMASLRQSQHPSAFSEFGSGTNLTTSKGVRPNTHAKISRLQTRKPGSNLVFTMDLILDYPSCQGYPDTLTNKTPLGDRRKYFGQLAMRALVHLQDGAIVQNGKRKVPYSRSISGDREEPILQSYRLPIFSTTANSKNVDTASYLCDVGHFVGGSWVAPGRTYASSVDPGANNRTDKVQVGAPHLVFVGDSTAAQVERCVYLKSEGQCTVHNPIQCGNYAFHRQYCETMLNNPSASSTSTIVSSSSLLLWRTVLASQLEGRSPETYLAYAYNQRQPGTPSLDVLLERALARLEDRNSEMWLTRSQYTALKAMAENEEQYRVAAQELIKRQAPSPLHIVFVMNIGLHEMVRRTWQQQKSHLLLIVNGTMKLLTSEDILKTQNNSYSFIWRSTWSIHEYCFHRNDFWFPRGHGYNKVQKTANSPSILYLRDATAYLQWSYTYDLYCNMTKVCDHPQGAVDSTGRTMKYRAVSKNRNNNVGGAFYITDEYWLTKSRMKRKGLTDMRHHDIFVVGETVKGLLSILQDDLTSSVNSKT
jgi:hypothetical protein